MKIGILTFHNNKNRGSMLQGYCLKESIGKNTNIKTEIIDYRTISHELRRIVSKSPMDIIKNIKEYNRTEKILSDLDILSEKRKITNNYGNAIKFIENQNYDMIVVGSDTVWKVEDSVLSRPIPNAYFLDESMTSFKASYAASANKTYPEKLTSEEKMLFKSKLGSFDKISVRDDYTKKLLEEMGIDDIRKVPDPTILEEIPEIVVTEILKENNISLDKPILGIDRVRDKSIKKVGRYYKSRGYQIVSPTSHDIADVNFHSNLHPFEYYSLYKHFDFFITGSLHSTIFSIKNNTPFATVETSNQYERAEDSKTYSLLKDFGMLDRYIDAIEGLPEDLLERVKDCERDLDEKHVESRIGEMRKQGLDYIRELGDLL